MHLAIIIFICLAIIVLALAMLAGKPTQGAWIALGFAVLALLLQILGVAGVIGH